MIRRIAFSFLLATAAAPAAPDPVEFNRDIRPILSDRCYSCHGPDAANRQAGLRLDQEAAAKAVLRDDKTPIVPGDPAKSEVFRRVTQTNPALRMPPAYAAHDALPKREIDLLRDWIEQGAKWQKHWSFLPPKRSVLPPAGGDGWERNAIDYFVRARLEREGLQHSPEAPKETLLRRVSLDLTGLPPTPGEVDAFLADKSPNAYEAVVDRLLASPRYAEHMAIRWLEAARYADTNGYQSDGVRDMYRWRDWVIDAFDRNMPFDRFTIEQIAGDLLPHATLSQKIATGFHRNHRTSAEGGIVDEEFRVEYVADRTETTATVWLGLTLGCARCHDHKYDPLLQREFYQFFAFFNNVPEKGFVYNFGNEPPYIKAPTGEQQRGLELLEKVVGVAQSEWDSRKQALQREQRKWEHSIRKKRLDWAPTVSLVTHQALDDNPKFDGQREVNLGETLGKFNHRDPLTLSAWIRPTSPKGAIVTRTEDYWEGTGYGLYLVDGKLRFHFVFRWTDLGLRVETKEPLALNKWQHVAVTYDGSMSAAKGVHLYVDGREQEMKVLFDQHLWPINHKAPLKIGAGAGLHYDGDIRDVRVYSRALDAPEVATLPMAESLSDLAKVAPGKRTPLEQSKLDLAFLDQYLPNSLERVQHELKAAHRAYDAYLDRVPTVMVMKEGPPRAAFILKRGAYDQHGEQVFPGVPAVLPPLPADAPRNRLGLARWLVSRDNPLTARVVVNRYWQMLFGTGIVKTIEDFGSQGEWPTHAELLDWLAVEFMDSGWDMKHILKTMVMSATYRQSSRVTPELLQKDPENRWLARGPRLRLSHEEIRDQALYAAGLLVEHVGGPSVKPYQPPGLWKELTGGSEYEPGEGEDLYRRSLYNYWRRTIAPPSPINFDSPTRETCIVRETRTNTPLQALNLMNDVTYLEAARKLGERAYLSGDNDPARLRKAVRLVLARSPRGKELDVLERTLDKFRKRYEASPGDAKKYVAEGVSARNPSIPTAELAAWTAIGSLLLNLDETITKE